jgi:uncharacterized protein (TIGR03435 family)
MADVEVSVTSGRWLFLLLLAATGATLAAQATPVFEVASIKVVGPIQRVVIMADNTVIGLGTRVTASRVDMQHESLLNLLCHAFRVRSFQIVGPEWLTDPKLYVDIQVTIPQEGTPQQVPEMLQALLVDRFGLAVHRDQRQMSVYALVTRTGASGLTPSTGPDLTEWDRAAHNAKAEIRGNGMVRRNYVQMQMDDLVRLLTPPVGRPVMDSTRLAGRYDFSMEITQEDYRRGNRDSQTGGAVEPTGTSWFGAVRRLGLDLVERRDAVDVVVVDRMNKTPTEN